MTFDHLALLTQAQAAALLDVDRTTISRWVRKGKLRVEGQVGGVLVFRRCDLEGLVRDHRGRKTKEWQ